MSAFTPTDRHRDDVDADWAEVAAEHEALTEFRERFGNCTDDELHQRMAGLMEAGIAMVGPMSFRRVKAEAELIMRERGLR